MSDRDSPAHRWSLAMGLAVAGGLLMSVTGAFGTGDIPFLVRTPYWIGQMVMGTAVALSARPLVARTGLLRDWVWAEAAVVALIITTVGAPIIWMLTSLVYSGKLEGRSLEFFVGPVAVLSVVMTALNYALQRRAVVTHAAPPGQTAPPRLHERLPAKLRGADIRAVEAQDHYLKVHTDRGEALILLRLADAIVELEGI